VRNRKVANGVGHGSKKSEKSSRLAVQPLVGIVSNPSGDSIMKFLCLVYFSPNAFNDTTPEEMRRLDDATIEHDRKLRANGHLLIASPLAGQETEVTIDRRVRLSMEATDGPFAEAKEVVGGFLLIEAQDMEEALSLFADDPIAAYARLQIRPLMEAHRHSQTGDSRPDFEIA
jgi:hypothetical protein